MLCPVSAPTEALVGSTVRPGQSASGLGRSAATLRLTALRDKGRAVQRRV